MNRSIAGIFERDRTVSNFDNEIITGFCCRVSATRDVQRVVSIEAFDGIIAVARTVFDHIVGTVDIYRIIACAGVYYYSIIQADNIIVAVAGVDCRVRAAVVNGIVAGSGVDLCTITKFVINQIVTCAAVDLYITAFVAIDVIVAGSGIDFYIMTVVVNVIIAVAGTDRDVISERTRV